MFFLALCFLLPHKQANAQDQDRKVIQLSGIILNADSTDAVPGVNVYVPKKGRGTSSGRYGYFSMPVLEGDSVIFSFIGMKRQTYKVPAVMEDDKISLIVTMQTDEIALSEIEVMPFPTEEEFKRQLLAANFDAPMSMDVRGNLSPETLLRYAEGMDASGNENWRYFQQGQMMQIQDRYGPRPFTLVDPFAWSRFIQSIKRGDLRKRD
ncbi:carboxypeptidase-like regulatory domain-containing protein [Indibacter alkaliphilus]|uniref:carboxypeptidase-like regulatory domain-containing protein n=1 Tax=Indibacter alkaliphilus TaxID=579922 RepID=UPI001F2727BB|nr:carboxypeptidase-like regulatory domain-containing protein [Indibacter alkaliphilus]